MNLQHLVSQPTEWWQKQAVEIMQQFKRELESVDGEYGVVTMRAECHPDNPLCLRFTIVFYQWKDHTQDKKVSFDISMISLHNDGYVGAFHAMSDAIHRIQHGAGTAVCI